VDYYVDGALVLSNIGGGAEAFSPILLFGGTDGNFNPVQLQAG
jgi:hypothetical protein